MIKPKLKRGKHLEIIATGEETYLYIIKNDGNYLCCPDKSFPVTGLYLTFTPEEVKEVGKVNKPLQSKPKSLTQAEKQFKAELNTYFATDTIPLPKRCEECGAPFNIITAWDKRCVTGHILEKAHFKSVATHPSNKIFLGTYCGCHSRHDNATAKERSEMKCYPVELQRYEKFKHKLTAAETVRSEKYLNISR